jgi:hypothetical protein
MGAAVQRRLASVCKGDKQDATRLFAGRQEADLFSKKEREFFRMPLICGIINFELRI